MNSDTVNQETVPEQDPLALRRLAIQTVLESKQAQRAALLALGAVSPDAVRQLCDEGLAAFFSLIEELSVEVDELGFELAEVT